MAWTRRRFLILGATGMVATACALALGQFGPYPLDEEARRRLRVLGAKDLVVLRALARRILAPDTAPGERSVPTPDELGVAEYVDGWLAGADAATRRDVPRLLGVIEHGTPLLGGHRRRFTDLPPAQQDAYLLNFSTSRIGLLREGFSAIKALCLMGYYRDPRTWPLCGYEGPVVPPGYDVHGGPP
jgi:hypothetical protein